MTKRDVTQTKETLIISLLFCLFILAMTGCHRVLKNEPGPRGADGEGCVVIQLQNGVEIRCGGQTSAIVVSGPTEVNTYYIVEIIDPCGRQGTVDDKLLRMNNGMFFRRIKHDQGDYLEFLKPGKHVTDDYTECEFEIHEDQTVTW